MKSPFSLDNKVLEIRDAATHIPALAIKMLAQTNTQAWYVHDRMGYPRDGSCIALVMLSDCDGNCDPYAWGNSTMATAHQYIYEHFDELSDGDVIDVEFIRGVTKVPKVSERLTVNAALAGEP